MSSQPHPSVMAPADAVLHAADKYALKLATVESCTGGLLGRAHGDRESRLPPTSFLSGSANPGSDSAASSSIIDARPQVSNAKQENDRCQRMKRRRR